MLTAIGEYPENTIGSSTQTTFPTAVTGKIAAPTVVTFIQTEDRLQALALRDEHDGQDEHGDAECHRDGAVIIVQRVIWLDPFRLIDIDDDRHALADFALVRIGDIVGHFDLFSLVFPFIQPDDQILRAHVDVKVFFIGQVFCSDLHDRSFHIFQRGAVKAAV